MQLGIKIILMLQQQTVDKRQIFIKGDIMILMKALMVISMHVFLDYFSE